MTELAVVIVGAGPTASSLLERLAANAPSMLAGRRVAVHLIDPHRAGTGRVWRPDNHSALWMNSLAEDVTMFTDDSVTCTGPIRPGPSLYEWSQEVDAAALARVGADTAVIDEVARLTPTTFPSRRVQSAYLEWFYRGVLAELPPELDVVSHVASAVDLVDDPDGRQSVHLDDGSVVRADVVVLSLGHLDAEQDAAGVAIAEFAEAHDLHFVGAGHTAELDLDGIEPGADAITLGFGQAFTDLVVLLTEGRGGRFVDDADGLPRYEASGREPVIHVGSRRGVPYRSKIDYGLQARRARYPRFLDERTLAELFAGAAPLDFRRDVLPLVLAEVQWAYYHELFHAHPGRVGSTWERFAEEFASAASMRERDVVVRRAVLDERDVFEFDRINSPLDGLRFASAAALHDHVRDHVRSDVERRTDPAYSADLAAFYALLATFGTIGRIVGSERLTPRSRVDDVGEWWFSFFMYYASGPPPARLRQLLALEAAGLVRFIGAHTQVHCDPARRRFVASSSSHPDEITGTVLIESRIARPSLSHATDRLLTRLRDRGEIVEEVVVDGEWQRNTGKVLVSRSALHLVDASGRPNARRHGLGAYTSRPAAGAFARPRTNAPAFRQNDEVARTVLATLAALEPERDDAAGVAVDQLA